MADGDSLEVDSYRNRPIHDALGPIIWLHGKWRSEDGQGVFPSISSFKYGEEIEFSSVGQPMLNYTSFSWNPEKNIPMHLESGFLRIKPGSNCIAFMVAHNFGLATVEEGKVEEKTIVLECNDVSRMSFAKEPSVLKTKRVFNLKSEGVLEQVLYMETTKDSMTEHLRITYSKVD